MHVTEHHDDRGCLVRLRGSLDVRTTADLRLHLHRVIAAGRSLGGFMGQRAEGFELSIKRWLLEHEGAV